MSKIVPLLVALLPGQAEPLVATRFQQVHPASMETPVSLPLRPHAVVLIHGIKLHPLSSSRVAEPIFHDWQLPGSSLVDALGQKADVFAFAYGQNQPLEAIADHPALANAIAKLKFLGYEEITLVGHSAGGMLARLFVEDHPRAGVTRVLQVCAPNDGSSWAKANFSVRREQEPFLQSLTRKERLKAGALRRGTTIPLSTHFLCVVGVAGTYGDGMVAAGSQWPADLQKQGIPAVRLPATHWTAVRSQKNVELLADLARTEHPRWTPAHVEEQRRKILGSP